MSGSTLRRRLDALVSDAEADAAAGRINARRLAENLRRKLLRQRGDDELREAARHVVDVWQNPQARSVDPGARYDERPINDAIEDLKRALNRTAR